MGRQGRRGENSVGIGLVFFAALRSIRCRTSTLAGASVRRACSGISGIIHVPSDGGTSALMLGELIANLDRPDAATAVLSSLEPGLVEKIKVRAVAASMTPGDFASGAVREFVERADDELWFQLLTLIRRAEDPGLEAIRTILRWVVASDNRERGP